MLAGAAVCVAVFAVGIRPRDAWILDDALIYQNFVRSALEGHGFGYGPHNLVEGYSSPVWVLLLTAAGLVGAKGFIAAKIIGAVCGAATCVTTALVPVQRNRYREVCLAAALLALQPSLLWWSATGLETPLVTLLVAVIVLGAIWGRPTLVAVAGGLAAVVRPEGAMFAFAAWVWICYDARRRGAPLRSVVGLTAVIAAPLAAWHAFRFAVYGTLVANSALVKLGPPAIIGHVKQSGFAYLADSFTTGPGPWILFAVTVAAALAFRRSGKNRAAADPESAAEAARANGVMLLVILLVALDVVFIVAVRGDWMPRHRFVVHVVPAMVLWGAYMLARREGAWRAAILASMAVGILLTAYLHFTDLTPKPEHGQYLVQNEDALRTPFVDPLVVTTGTTFYTDNILRYTVPGDGVLHLDVGQSGYIANDVEILDQYGLVSRFEAEYLSGRRSDDELRRHFAEVRPAVCFVPLRYDNGISITRIGVALADELRDNYTEVASATCYGFARLAVLVRRDALGRQPDPARLDRWEAEAPGLLTSSPYPDIIPLLGQYRAPSHAGRRTHRGDRALLDSVSSVVGSSSNRDPRYSPSPFGRFAIQSATAVTAVPARIASR